LLCLKMFEWNQAKTEWISGRLLLPNHPNSFLRNAKVCPSQKLQA
jgi:hypothetical protein